MLAPGVYDRGGYMECKKCGKEIPDESKFCLFCGYNQTKAAPRKALKRANGTGSVYKLQGRRKRPWVASKGKTIIGYYETKTAALDAVNRMYGTEITDRYNMTFAQVFEKWKEEHYPTLTEKGIEQYENAYKIFSELHSMKFRTITTHDYQKIMNRHLHKSHSTVSKYKQLLTQMSKFAFKYKVSTENYAKYVTLNKQEKPKKIIFTANEIEKLEQNNSETAKIVLMLIYTGMRLGELLTLPLKDYHTDYVIAGSKTAAGRDRFIPIRPEGKQYFSYFAACATGDLLLSGYSGNKNQRNFRERDYYPLLKDLDIPKKRPHSTRHTYATWASSIKMQNEVLKEILGHEDYSTTANIYIQIQPETLLAAVNGADVTNTLQTNSV